MRIILVHSGMHKDCHLSEDEEGQGMISGRVAYDQCPICMYENSIKQLLYIIKDYEEGR